ncbi:hypothetical protein [Chryseobacterium sp.]|nr:hypothetical protein [Chryseobacterium sp.]
MKQKFNEIYEMIFAAFTENGNRDLAKGVSFDSEKNKSTYENNQ